MSAANVELVRSIYAAWRRGEFSSADWATPDVEIDLSAVYPDQPVMRGVGEARRFRDTAWGTSQRFEPERYFDVDDERVLVFVRASAIGRHSGARVDARPAHEFTLRDGLVVRLKVHHDRDEALEAAGLSA